MKIPTENSLQCTTFFNILIAYVVITIKAPVVDNAMIFEISKICFELKASENCKNFQVLVTISIISMRNEYLNTVASPIIITIIIESDKNVK